MINNRYSIIKKIGEGRSKVFICSDKFFPDEKIAIKILQYTANDSEIEFFNKEFEIINRLSHPSIISVYDKGSILNLSEDYKSQFKISENDKYITMEWVDGKSFNNCDELHEHEQLKSVIKQISLVLYYIHQANYIYFDLKPENILIYKSESGLRIKIIDFGLAVFYPNLSTSFIRGTSEYLAPEILKKEKVSFNVDLYSFGIMLYHFAYQKFPFRNDTELEIFRAQIEKEFEYPSSKVSPKIISIIKKLLNKNPKKRFNSSLEVISALEFNLSIDEKINLTNPLSYVERVDTKTSIDSFLKDEIWGRIAVLSGERGSGKSLFLGNILRFYKNSVLIRTSNFISATNFWQQFFSRLIYSEAIYRNIDDSLVQYVSLHIDDGSEELLVELKTIISKIASITSFTLIIDDFDKLEVKNIEIFFKLFPILLANNIKIILSTSSESKVEFPLDIDKEIIEIAPFSNNEIHELVEHSFNNFINKNEMGNLIVSFSERLPAKISYFMSELIASEIINFNDGQTTINYDEKRITKLLSSQDELYKLQKENLSINELEILETISLFENEIPFELISEILDIKIDSAIAIVTELRNKHILQPSNINRNPSIINVGFKKYIYSNIKNVEEKHSHAGNIIVEKFPKMDVLLSIRQYELAKEYKRATEIIDSSLDNLTTANYPQIRIKLLSQLLTYNLSLDKKIDTLLSLTKVNIEIGKYSEANKIIRETSSNELSKYSKYQKDYLNGVLLIKTGSLNDGIKLLVSTVDKLPKQKNEIYLELASAYIELNKYSSADSICREILKQSDEDSEIIGRAQNLQGIINLYDKSDLNNTLKYFQEAHKTYTTVNNFNRIAGSEVNLGNIQNILGNYSRAEKHWNKALQLNRSIGNVDQEANVLLNNGIFYYEHANYEKAIEFYQKAGSIFKGLGNKHSFGLVNTNLCETYLEICEFQKALDAISVAKEIFTKLNNFGELIEILLLEVKLYILVSNYSELNNTIEQIRKYIPLNSEKGRVLLEFYIHYSKNYNTNTLDLEKINTWKKALSQNNDRLLAADFQFLLASEYNKLKEYGISISLLHSKMLTDICEFNNKYEANRLFLLSKIPTKYQSDLSLTKNYLLQKSYAILQNNSISELTILVLNDLAQFYYERGNSSKAKEFALISEAIIDYIALETTSVEVLSPFFEKRIGSLISNNTFILNLE